ncbi:MAG: class I SAM-dependent methyltransferase [Streptosporangiaceae bacterium]
MRYAHNAAAYEAEEWSRPDEMALFNLLWTTARRELDARPGSRVLDLCCGSGMSLLGIVSHPHIDQALGLDIAAPLVEFASLRYRPFGNVFFLQSDAVCPPLQPDSFDLIVASSAYHHIRHHLKRDFLMSCVRLLKHDGILLMAENVLPPYLDDEHAYDSAVRELYGEVLDTALSSYPDLPPQIRDMIDENVILSLRREYEFKVSREQLLSDAGHVGLVLRSDARAWPSDAELIGRTGGNFLFTFSRRSSAGPAWEYVD